MKLCTAVICLAVGLCCTIGCCKRGSNRLDVILEGPWIIYQDTQFGSNGAKVPVLVAIAPISATSQVISSGDYFHHHSPQLSTGDGFYIKRDYLKKARIFCLFFDDKCAPETTQTPATDMYPQSRLLALTPKGGPKNWEWVKAVRGSGVLAAALILPMPDSISNDGVWNMRFNSKGDEKHNIGVQLHYTNGPKNLILRSCDESAQPSIATCNNPVADAGQAEPSKLENTGTLRLQMRAPDNTDACDWHVRYAWDQTWKLLGTDFPSDYANIEPAASIDANGVGTYISCDKSNPIKGNPSIKYPRDEMPVPSAHAQGVVSSSAPLGAEMLYTDFLNQFNTDIKEILDSIEDKDKSDPDLKYFVTLKTEVSSLNPNFPRISQLTLIGKLLDSSQGFVDRLKKEHSADKALMGELKEFEDRAKTIKADADTKNGGDCRAAITAVQ